MSLIKKIGVRVGAILITGAFVGGFVYGTEILGKAVNPNYKHATYSFFKKEDR
jgi:hypothetical protein